MRLLALNVRYFGKVKWDPNVINTLSTMLGVGRTCGDVMVGLQGMEG